MSRESQRLLYERRRAQGLCVSCGRGRDRKRSPSQHAEAAQCSACVRKQKEREVRQHERALAKRSEIARSLGLARVEDA